jgi:large subunit ribosomal protein L29
MKAKELRDLSLTELKSRRKDEKEALQNMTFNHAVAGQLENPARLGMTRKEIARLNTIIHEKENQESAD